MYCNEILGLSEFLVQLECFLLLIADEAIPGRFSFWRKSSMTELWVSTGFSIEAVSAHFSGVYDRSTFINIITINKEGSRPFSNMMQDRLCQTISDLYYVKARLVSQRSTKMLTSMLSQCGSYNSLHQLVFDRSGFFSPALTWGCPLHCFMVWNKEPWLCPPIKRTVAQICTWLFRIQQRNDPGITDFLVPAPLLLHAF
jgi:hypothetical protein